jgi:hypothetical protein
MNDTIETQFTNAVTQLNSIPSVDQMVSAFTAAGIKGARLTPNKCPVSLYLMKLLRNPTQEYVSCSQISIVLIDPRQEEEVVLRLAPSAVVADFISHHDHGEFPQLQADGQLGW